MQRSIRLFFGFMAGLIFMGFPLNPGAHGFILEIFNKLVQLVGTICVLIFGSVLIHDAWETFRNRGSE